MNATFRAVASAGAVLVALTGLAVSQSAALAAPRSPAAALAAQEKSVPANASSSASAAASIRSCFDGTCRIRVRTPVTIPVDSRRFGFSSVHVTVSGSMVDVSASGPGFALGGGSTVPGDMGLNNLRIHAQSLHGKIVTLVFSH